MRNAESSQLSSTLLANVRTHPVAMTPEIPHSPLRIPHSRRGTFLTGEMFAPILREQIDKFNAQTGARLTVMAVPNGYFGGDVSVAGLLTGQDLAAMKDKVVGDFVVIPRTTIKSDEPIFLDGMTYDALKAQFKVPVFDLDTGSLIEFLSTS